MRTWSEAIQQIMRHERLSQADVVERLHARFEDVQPLHFYFWLDGIELPKTEEEFMALARALRIPPEEMELPLEAGGLKAIWNAAKQTHPPDLVLSVQNGHPRSWCRDNSIGNRIVTLDEDRRYNNRRSGKFSDNASDPHRIYSPDPEHGYSDYKLLEPDVLEYISQKTQSFSEFLKVNRFICGWPINKLNQRIHASDKINGYERDGQFPPFLHEQTPEGNLSAVDLLNKALFKSDAEAAQDNDPEKSKAAADAKRQKLRDLVIAGKVRAAEYSVEDHKYRAYVKFSYGLPKEYWQWTLLKFNDPEQFEARTDKPIWADHILLPATVGDLIRTTRLYLGKTQAQIADVMGLTESSVRAIETDRDSRVDQKKFQTVCAYFEQENKATIRRGEPAFFDLALAEHSFETWQRIREETAAEAAPDNRVTEPQIAQGIDTQAKNIRGDSHFVKPRHKLFLNHRLDYEGISKTQNGMRTISKIAAESRNFYEFVEVSRILRNWNRKDMETPDLNSEDIKRIESGASFPKLEKLEILSNRLFHDNPANAARLMQLYIEGKVAIAAGSLANGEHAVFQTHLLDLPKDYWDQVFLKFCDRATWDAQPNPPAWKDAVMDITTAGLFIKIYRIAHHIDQPTMANELGINSNKLSALETSTQLSEPDKQKIHDAIRYIATKNDEAIARGEPPFYNPEAELPLASAKDHRPWPRSAYHLDKAPAQTQR